jgi:hydroxyacid-oxoacid transhydrogenase
MRYDTAFQISIANIRFGVGVTSEVGADLQSMGVRRVLVVCDPQLSHQRPAEKVRHALREAGLIFEWFDQVRIEPTDQSLQEAIQYARSGKFDAYVALGGGSTLDTAKVANLYATHPADFLDYVNQPFGRGCPIPGPLCPLIAIPTTAGTGSETTGVAVFDLVERHAKTGISHRHLKPTLGLIDPENTRGLPPAVIACAGLDVLSHALESYTALLYYTRPRPEHPLSRPTYQGANPVSDLWSLRALELVAEYLLPAHGDSGNLEARSQMLLAASLAGIGFGNAGVHLPHAMAYPVAGMVRDYRPPGYSVDSPLVPHGMSVILHTPAVVRWTATTSPARHLRAAEALGVDIRGVAPAEAGNILADRVIWMMKQLGMPSGLEAIGYQRADIPKLVEGTLAQQRITQLAPRPVGANDVAELFENSLRIWE